MNILERSISDRSFEKLARPSFRPSGVGRTVRNAGKAAGRALRSGGRRAANAAAHSAEDIAGASTDAGTDGIRRMVEGEAANRGIEAGGGALSNYGQVGAIGSAGVRRGASSAIRSGANNSGGVAGNAVNTAVRSIPKGTSVGVQSRVQAVKNMRNARKANMAARTARQAARPTRQMMLHEAERAGLKSTSNYLKALQKSNAGGRIAARAGGSLISKGMPLIGLGVDMGLDGVVPALKENFSLVAPETDSTLETMARAGGDLLTIGSGFVNPVAIPQAVAAGSRTAHRVARTTAAGTKAHYKQVMDAARRGDQDMVGALVSSRPVFRY